MTKIIEIFESETCTRCGGTGKFSWCRQHRDTCFKCGGQGKVLTKRGLATREYWKSIRVVKFPDVEIGMMVKCGNCTPFFKVETIRPDPLNAGMFMVEGRDKYEKLTGAICHDNGEFTLPSKPEHVTLSLQYQAKLTKAGKLMKKFQ